MCHNNLYGRSDTEDMLMHELVHAYDHCKARELDWFNCKHHACTEVRAANLSGDCRLSNELARGHFSLRGQRDACMRRRAQLSVLSNPSCTSYAQAQDAVNAVFDQCKQDTRPFDSADDAERAV